MLTHLCLTILVLGCAGASAEWTMTPWPQTKPQGTGMFSAVAVDPASDRVWVAQRNASYKNPILVYNTAGALLGSWGKGDIAELNGSYGVHGFNIGVYGTESQQALYATDVIGHVVMVFTLEGKKIAEIGSRGKAGTGTDPIQFGNVADVDFKLHSDLAVVSDGDGGVNDRVIGLNITDITKPLYVSGTLGSGRNEYNSPHSVTVHQRTSTVLIADRGNNRTKQLDVEGNVKSIWTCMQPGTPWGLRMWNDKDILFVADGDSQRLTMFSLAAATPGSLGPCTVVQKIPIDASVCGKPHELAVDQTTGDVYVSCVAANFNMLKFKYTA